MELADTVARRLRAQGLRGRTVTLKYRDETFHTVTRAETQAQALDASNVLFAIASRLFEAVHGSAKVRLLGIYVSHFGEAGPQLDLFGKGEALAPSRADQLRDELARRFGPEAITRASLLGKRERRNPSDKPVE